MLHFDELKDLFKVKVKSAKSNFDFATSFPKTASFLSAVSPIFTIISIISTLFTIANYLLKPQADQISSLAASPTYNLDGIRNDTNLGTPVNIPYGEIRPGASIINWIRRGYGDEVWAHIILSLGHGPIAGVKQIYINGQPIEVFYNLTGRASGDTYHAYLTHGDEEQQVYKFINTAIGTVSSITGDNSNATITIADFHGKDAHDTIQITNSGNATGSALARGYGLIYDSIDTSTPRQSEQMISYVTTNASPGTTTALQLGGCKLSKTPVSNPGTRYIFKQMYQVVYDRDLDDVNDVPIYLTSAKETIPVAEDLVVQRILPDVVLGGIDRSSDATSPQVFASAGTANGLTSKIQKFSITFAAENGLYKFDEMDGYKKTKVKMLVEWKKRSDSWSTRSEQTDVVRDQTTATSTSAKASGFKISVTEGDNYCLLNSPALSEGLIHQETIWDNVKIGDIISFVGDLKYPSGATTTFKFYVGAVDVEAVGFDANLDIETFKHKIVFEGQAGPGGGDDIYLGKTGNYDYTITGTDVINLDKHEFIIPREKEYYITPFQTVYTFPEDAGLEESVLDYDLYDIKITKLTVDHPNTNNKDDHSQNEIKVKEITGSTVDVLSYPGEALLGLKLKMTDAINGTIDQITVDMEGKLVKDVTSTGTSVSAWQASTNYSRGDRVRPTTANGYYYRCVNVPNLFTYGTTASSEPTWPKIAGALVKDGGVTWREDATRFSSNPMDIIADLTTSEVYSRGASFDLTQSDLDSMWSQYSTAASSTIPSDVTYCNQEITENDIVYPRMRIDINVDVRKRFVESIQFLSKCFKAFNYWDGSKFMTYIDRASVPVTMFNNANIVPQTVQSETPELSSFINRIYAQFLNRNKNYEQDQVGMDWIDQGFSIDILRPTTIVLYCLKDIWYVRKIIKWMLKASKYTAKFENFNTGLDGALVRIGQTFHYSNSHRHTVTCGKILAKAASSTAVTADKAFSKTSGQKLMLRLNTGLPQEFTVAVTSSSATIITSETLPATVVANALYSVGTGTAYYDTYRCIIKKSFGSSYNIIGALYDKRVFEDNYKSDPVADENSSGGTDEPAMAGSGTTPVGRRSQIPARVLGLGAKEHLQSIGSVLIQIMRPKDPKFKYAKIQMRQLDRGDWENVGTSDGGVIQVNDRKIGIKYEIRAFSVSHRGVVNPRYVRTTVRIDGSSVISEPKPVSNLQFVGQGSETNVLTDTFRIRWSPVVPSTEGADKFYAQALALKSLDTKYMVTVKFSGIPNTVNTERTGNVGSIPAYEIEQGEQSETFFEYPMWRNEADIGDIFEGQTNHADFDTYYRVAQREITFTVYTLDIYKRRSDPRFITLTNPAPKMVDSSGATTTPGIKPILSGSQITWRHPFHSFSLTAGDVNYVPASDISHFIVKSMSLPQWTKKTAFAIVGNFVSPTTANGYAFAVDTFGVSGDTEPTWPTSIGATVSDGGVVWRNATSVASLFSGNSGVITSKEIAAKKITRKTEVAASTTTYTYDIKPLDPKRGHYHVVVPYDVFGEGESTKLAHSIPGLTEDDEQNDIAVPSAPGTVNFTIEGNTAGRIEVTDPGDLDIAQLHVQWRGIQDTTATIQPTAGETADKITAGGTVCAGGTFGTGNIPRTTSATLTTHLRDLKAGWKYFARVRIENSSGQKGEYDKPDDGLTAWASHSTAVVGVAPGDLGRQFQQYTYTGTFSATDHDTVSWSAGTLSFKTSNSTTDNFTINSGNSGNLSTTEPRYYLTWSESASSTITVTSRSSYLNSPNVVPLAYVKVTTDTDDKAVVDPFVQEKDFQLVASQITAGSIRTAALDALAVTAAKIDLDGILNIVHGGGGGIQYRDSAGTIRMYQAVVNNGTPILKMSKEGFDASVATAPAELLFDSRYNYEKIVESGSYAFESTTFPTRTNQAADTTSSGTVKLITISGATTRKRVKATYGNSAGLYVVPLPHISGPGGGDIVINTSGPVWQVISVSYDPPNGQIRLKWETINDSTATQTFTAPTGTVHWELEAEKIDA